MSSATATLEAALAAVVDRAADSNCPPRFAQALRHSVFPAGARVRPALCLAVAAANGNDDPVLALAAACSVELLHCASLVHDDLPCFDDAAERRGQPSVHAAFGERLAVLAGDALIVSAFESLAFAAAHCAFPARLAPVLGVLGRGVGAPLGIAAGQAWECEPAVDLSLYHRAKTGALFVASTAVGAAAAGVSHACWETLGERIGEAYQIADDIRDATAEAGSIGKPTGRDAALGRPNAVHACGLDGAVRRLRQLIAEGLDSMPACPGRGFLSELVLEQSSRFLPKGLARLAA